MRLSVQKKVAVSGVPNRLTSSEASGLIERILSGKKD